VLISPGQGKKNGKRYFNLAGDYREKKGVQIVSIGKTRHKGESMCHQEKGEKKGRDGGR